jgi:hypothetical protein
MTNLIQVEGYNDMARDTNSKAIINTNSKALKQAKEIRERKLKEKQEIQNLKNDVQEIKSTLEQILILLKENK